MYTAPVIDHIIHIIMVIYKDVANYSMNVAAELDADQS